MNADNPSSDKLSAKVRRVSPFANAIDIQGEITSFTEKTLSEAYAQSIQGNFRTVIFNFTGLKYMNSFGIGMLVTLLIRARREGKNIVGYGLNEHYRKIFEITRLDQVIPLYSTEETALSFAEPHNLPEREY
jgi:anti-sigma B factor antagonist